MLILSNSIALYILIVMFTILSSSSLRLIRNAFKPINIKSKLYSNTKLCSVVNTMNVKDFKAILKSSERSDYQIIDVREKDELMQISLSDPDVINLPLGSANIWTAEVSNGKILDSSKPTLCLCKIGMRSMKVATYLGIN